ncbi:hypothetical protein GBAR_LOCUS2690, partial [Geodia barretti]
LYISLLERLFVPGTIPSTQRATKRQRGDGAKGDKYLVEIKVLIIISVSNFGFIVLAGSDSIIQWGADSIRRDVEARGLIPGLHCSRDSFNSAFSILDTVGVMVRAILPVFFILLFLVDFKSVRRCLLGHRQLNLQLSTRLTLSQSTIV